MLDNHNGFKRIAFVTAALTGEELQASQRDATTIFTILTDPQLGMCHPKQSRLIHQCSSKTEFETAFSLILDQWDSTTQLILYFSGHGEVIKNNYCLKFEKTIYPFKNLINELDVNGVSRAILILDTCHSGAAIGYKNHAVSIINADDIPQGIAIITSSKRSQQSYELDDGSHSVFTSILRQGIETGLDGKPTDSGLISVNDIVTYIQNKLKYPEYFKYNQNPVFEISKADKDIWITKNRSGIISKKDINNFEASYPNVPFVKSYDELKILYEQNAPSWHPCINALIDDLDLNLLKRYSNDIEPGLYDSSNLEKVLNNLTLYSPILYDGKKFLHKSAVLCFHKRPHKVYPQSRAVFVVNPGDAKFVREDIYGPLSSQVQQLVKKVEKYINEISYIDKDGTRRNVADIDISIARELISNAITHRDYEASSTVRVAITSEALEVYNPGSFPSGKSWGVLLHSSLSCSLPTDAAIALYLSNLLVYEGIGRGFEKFKKYIDENGSDSLICKEESGIVYVRLLRRRTSDEYGLTSASAKVVSEIFKNISLGNDITIGDITQTFFTQEVNIQPPKNIPVIGVSSFVGREEEIAKINEILQKENRFQILAITGIPGVGKTELVIQYANQYIDDYSGGICWLNGGDGNLQIQILQFFKNNLNLEAPQNLTLSEQVVWCWRNWRPSTGIVLIVIDNVADFQNLFEILPQEKRFRVLITTGSRNIDPRISEITLHQLPRIEALMVLTYILGKERIQKEQEEAENLCEFLGYLPLAINLLGRYLAADPDLSLKYTLEELLQQEVNLQNLPAEPGLALRQVFELTWREIDSITQRIAKLLSLLAVDIIPWKLIEDTGKVLDIPKADINKAKKELFKRHLIERIEDKEKCYQIHPLLHIFFQGKLADSEKDESQNLRNTIINLMIEIVHAAPSHTTPQYVESLKDIIPHLKEIIQKHIDAIKDKDLLSIFVAICRFYEAQNLYQLAENWYLQGSSTIRNRLGEEHLDVAAIFNNQALLYQSMGRYTEALPLYERALKIYNQLSKGENPGIAAIYNNLAFLYEATGRYVEALDLYQKTLEVYKRVLGEVDPVVASTLSNLGLLYQSLGDYKHAEALFRQALDIRERLLGREHPQTASSFNNLAGIYADQGLYDEAESLYQQALKMFRHLFGEKHPNFAASLNNLAGLYQFMGRYREAEPLYHQVLEIYRCLFGDNHPIVATTLNNLASIYKSMRRYNEAEPLYQQALGMYKRLLGDAHPDVANCLNNLAELYQQQGRYLQAESLFLESLNLRKNLLGEEHPAVATSLNNLAGIYENQERYSEAEILLVKALEQRKKILGEEHPDIAVTLNNLGSIYMKQSKINEAENLLIKALSIVEKSLGQHHPLIVAIQNKLQNLKKADK